MCYQKFHECMYCNTSYVCKENNYNCPTINHDEDMNMCDDCKVKLENKIKILKDEDVNITLMTIEDILELDDE